jgi:hypothetical protein
MSVDAKNGKYVLVTGGAGYIGSHTVLPRFDPTPSPLYVEFRWLQAETDCVGG